jgi:hypothetical protein
MKQFVNQPNDSETLLVPDSPTYKRVPKGTLPRLDVILRLKKESPLLINAIKGKCVPLLPFLTARAELAGPDGITLYNRLEAILVHRIVPNTNDWIEFFKNA